MAMAHRQNKTHTHRDVAGLPVEAKVGGTLGGVLGAETEPLVALFVRISVFDRPVGFNVPEVQLVVCGVRLMPGGCVTIGAVS